MDVAANDDPALLMMPVVDGGLLPVGPRSGGGRRVGVRRSAVDRNHPRRVGVLHRREHRAEHPGRRRPATVDAATHPGGGGGRRPDRRGAGGAGRTGRGGAPAGPVGGHRHRVRVPAPDHQAGRRPRRRRASPGWAPTATCSRGSHRHSGGSWDRAMPWISRSCSGRSTIRPCRRFRVGARTPWPCRPSCAAAWTSFARTGSPGGWSAVGRSAPADDGARAVARERTGWNTRSSGRGRGAGGNGGAAPAPVLPVPTRGARPTGTGAARAATGT